MNFFLVYLAIELYVVGRLVLKDFYRLRANRIAKMEGALELGQAVALLGQKFWRTRERFDKANYRDKYLILEIRRLGAAIIRTKIIKGERSSAVAGF